MITTPDDIAELFEYRDGALWWRERGMGRQMGKPAGSVNARGYRYIGISGKHYRAGRSAA